MDSLNNSFFQEITKLSKLRELELSDSENITDNAFHFLPDCPLEVIYLVNMYGITGKVFKFLEKYKKTLRMIHIYEFRNVNGEQIIDLIIMCESFKTFSVYDWKGPFEDLDSIKDVCKQRNIECIIQSSVYTDE